MKGRHAVAALLCAVALALAVVHLRTRIVTGGYRLAAARTTRRELKEEIEKQRLEIARLTSGAQIEARRKKTPVNLEQPPHRKQDNEGTLIEP